MKSATIRIVSLGALSIAATVAWGHRADGYAVEVHKDFFDLAFGGQAAGRQVTPPTADGLTAFRLFVYQRARRSAEFRKRWPRFADFTPAAFKEFLALNPGKSVVAIDEVPAGRATDLRTVVREGSVDPDNDYRNQDRLFVQNGEVVLDAFGRAVPYDPGPPGSAA